MMPTECERCERLCASRRTIVNGFGPLDAEVWLVGQGPGREEEVQGRPFCGWSGDRVDYLLGVAGLDPDRRMRWWYVAELRTATDAEYKGDLYTLLAALPDIPVRRENITRCRPPRGKNGDLPPTSSEIANCHDYLLADLGENPPRVIIPLGGPATKWFLPTAKISEAHGRSYSWYEIAFQNDTNDSIMVVPMYHPAAAHPSRNPGLAQVMIEDWERLGTLLRTGIQQDTRSYQSANETELETYLRSINES